MAFFKPPLRTHVIGCRWFWVWAVLGCAAALDQHLNPLPWLAVGIALFVGGIVAHARRS